MPSHGFGTYRLQLDLDSNTAPLSLKIPRALSALKIWANGELLLTLGETAESVETELPKANAILVDLPRAMHIDLVILVSNYQFRVGGGFPQGIMIGDSRQLALEREQQLLLEALSIGIILVVIIMSALFYVVESRTKVFLYFSIFIFCGILRLLVTGESVLMTLFPEVSFDLIQQLRIVPFYLGMGIGALYFYRLFPNEFNKLIVSWFFKVSVLCSIFFIVTPAYIGSFVFIPYQFIAFFGLSYTVVSLIRAAKNKQPDAWLVLMTMTALALVMVNDLLVVQQVIDGVFLANYGFVAFVVMQVIVLFRAYKTNSQKVVRLSDDLNVAGQQLEYKQDDINTLVTDNAMRLEYKRHLMSQLKSLQALEVSELPRAIKSLQNELRSQMQVEEKLSFQQEHLDVLSTEFNKRLLERYPKLSKTEQEICGLMRLKLSTKEIASYRNTSDGAIRVAKNRIRKKIGIEAAKDLEGLMQNI